VRAGSDHFSSSTTDDTRGASTLGPPGASHSWLSTRAEPTQAPGSPPITGRKNVWLPRGQIQSTSVVMMPPARSRKYTFTLAAVTGDRFWTWIALSQPWYSLYVSGA